MEEKKIAYHVKLHESKYMKLRKESKKLGITMTAFLSMLISEFKSVKIEKVATLNNGETK